MIEDITKCQEFKENEQIKTVDVPKSDEYSEPVYGIASDGTHYWLMPDDSKWSQEKIPEICGTCMHYVPEHEDADCENCWAGEILSHTDETNTCKRWLKSDRFDEIGYKGERNEF